jgi:hypothetical protein
MPLSVTPKLSRHANRAPHRGSKFVPTVESLEDRSVPTVSVAQLPGSNVILIKATGRNDVIRIFDQGSNLAGAILINGTGHATPFASAALAPGQSPVIDLFTGGGTDRVHYFSLGLAAGTNRTLLVNLGALGNQFVPALARNVVLQSGELVQVGVNRSRAATGITLKFHGAVAGSSTLTVSPFLNPAVIDAVFAASLSGDVANLMALFGASPTFANGLDISVFGPNGLFPNSANLFAPPPNMFPPPFLGGLNAFSPAFSNPFPILPALGPSPFSTVNNPTVLD